MQERSDAGQVGCKTLEERRHQADMCTVHKLMHGVGGVDYRTWFDRASDSERVTRVAADSWNVKVKNEKWQIGLEKKLFQCESIQLLERCPQGDEENHASPPVQEGLQASPRVHVAGRLDSRQGRDRMPRTVRVPGTDFLQEGLPGPRRTTHQVNK